MPGYNETGQMGQGSMTGRGFGRCGNRQQINRKFLGFGRGRVFGFRRRFEPSDELTMLKQEAEYMKKDINVVEARIDNFEKNNRED